MAWVSWAPRGNMDQRCPSLRAVLRLAIAVALLAPSTSILAATWYVAVDGSDGAAGTNWFTAKQTIQAAVDAAGPDDTVLVSNGLYDAGGRVVYGAMTNRVAITNSITVQSLNGPEATAIQGAGPLGDNAIRCVYVAAGALVSGFTLAGGFTRNSGDAVQERSGGGALCEAAGVLSGCILTGNSADYGGGARGGALKRCLLSGNFASYGGGGSYQGVLDSCLLTDNSTYYWGGGSYSGILYNCTLARNECVYGGGGVYGGTLHNCIVWSNDASMSAADNCEGAGLSYCCTAPDPGGAGNITNDPQFVDMAGDNCRLGPGSPCRDRGNNADVQENADLDGRVRTVNNIVDIGAYEDQDVVLLALAGSHGTIDPSGTIFTSAAADVSFTMRPDAYYHVGQVTTNGSTAGAVTNFAWHNVCANGTVTVAFAEDLAALGTPHWWLAQYGWTQDFDSAETQDQDGDTLWTWQEYAPNSCPTNVNSDGDQYGDAAEFNTGADPARDDSRTYAAITNHPDVYKLYTSNSIMDLSYGEVMMNVVTGTIRVRLTLQTSDELGGNDWTNAGTSVDWQCPAASNRFFFRFLGD